jgi:hypothetical protein
MSYTIIISAVFLILIGLTALYRAYHHASEGYEDEFGFHAGSEPQGSGIRVARAAMAHRAKINGLVRVKRESRRVRHKHVEEGSTAPF